jgi:tetratricopeptide (TPR) repeat protein
VDKLLGLDPGERLKATAYATLIESLRTQGRYKEGNRIGRLLLTEGASDLAKTIAYYELACNSAELEEDLDEALRLAHLALEHSPPEIRRFPLAALGWVHYKRQELAEAVDCLTRSSELGPSARTFTHLGMALLASGEREEARTALAHARTLNGPQIPVGERLIECLRDNARLLDEVESKAKK